MDVKKLRQIVEWVRSANLAQLDLRTDEFSLRLVRPVSAAGVHPNTQPAAQDALLERDPTAPRVAASATLCGRFLSRHPLRDQPEVRVGERFEAGALVGLIAVGELFLPVTAQIGGVMGAFLVDDDQLVGYGTPLVSLADN